MKGGAGSALLVAAVAVASYLLLEGVYSIVRDPKPHTSLGHTLYKTRIAPDPPLEALPDYLQSERELRALREALAASGVIIGNTPFQDLATDEARTTGPDDELGLRFKPNLRTRSGQLRSRLYKALDPVSYGYIVDPSRGLDATVRTFLERYRLREIEWTTDAEGFRTTEPRIESDRVVALVGSSLCVGLFLRDEETVASRLQRRHPQVRILNACMVMTKVDQHLAMTRRLVRELPESLVGLVYTVHDRYFRDLDHSLAGLDAIADQLDAVNAGYRVLVYFHYIYESMPDVMRKRRDLRSIYANKAALIEHARTRGFEIVDAYDLVEEFREETGSLFAGMALYVDHGHFSAEGARRMAERIPPIPAGIGR